MAKRRTWAIVLGTLGLGTFGVVALCAGVLGPCWSAWIGDGVFLETCPVGNIRPTVTVQGYGLGRKDVGVVEVAVSGHYVDTFGGFNETPVRRFTPTLTLVAPDGKETALDPVDGWDDTDDFRQAAKVQIPEVPDGDYTLRVAVTSPAGPATLDVPLPLYQPALVHVLTDSPLYKPGQDVKFRAVVLGAADLAPLDGRPGVWKVYDPSGELLLEEKASAGAFGVVSGSFPLDAAADSGDWAVTFESGPASDRVTVAVRPFQLPRFTVSAASLQPSWRVGEVPTVKGTVRYTSGAPVARAPLRVRVGPAGGQWPAPNAWLEERTAVTDAQGGFTVALGEVPGDLRGQATFAVSVEAIDETGDTAAGGARVLLAEDPVAADAVTELAGGLVPAANNRVYLRVTTSDGRTLPGSTVRLRKEWDSSDPGVEAVADADGVARFQLDPGQPTTVVVPAMPVRPQPKAQVEAASLSEATDLLDGSAAGLADQAAFDRWTNAVRGCADRVEADGEEQVHVAALVDAGGRVRTLSATGDGGEDALSRCVAGRLGGMSGAGGRDTLWSLRWTVRDPGTAWITSDVEAIFGDGNAVDTAVEARLRDVRGCVVGVTEALDLPRAWAWKTTAGSSAVAFTPVADPQVDGQVGGGVASCVERALVGLRLDEDADDSAAGLLRLSVNPPATESVATPEPTTFPGFAFRVDVKKGDEALGGTILRMPVGEVPDLRLRFSEVIVDPGATVELTAVRGPNYAASFPDEMVLMQGDREVQKFPFDAEKRKGTVTIPPDVDGFVQVSWYGARAVLYVRPKRSLTLAMSTDAATYRPGQIAQLTVTAKDGAGPVAAGVTLSGVDSTLATLAALPEPDEFARVTVRATSDTPAFGVLDARALETGQIAGDNAAQAAVLRVTNLPSIPAGADRVNVSLVGGISPDAELADAFYELYRDARAEVRAWEEAAPAGDLLTAARMVELWEKALAAHPATDAFGRPLHLQVLPADLLALTDPRFMATDGARLPEDVENWSLFVGSEAP
jgi:hypothetical protein